MVFNQNIIIVSLGLLVLLLLGLLLKQCNKKVIANTEDWKAKYEYEKQRFDSIKSTQKVVVTESAKTIDTISGKKNTELFVKIKQVVVKHDTVRIPYSVIRDTCKGLNRIFKNDSVTGRLTDSGVYLDSLRFKNEISFTVSKIKGGYNIEAKNTNSAFRNSGMNSIMLKHKNPGRIGLGPYVGYDFINKRVGVGVSAHYSIIRN